MMNVKNILGPKEKKFLKMGAFLVAVYAMSYLGAEHAIKKTRFEIHLFGPDGNNIGYVD